MTYVYQLVYQKHNPSSYIKVNQEGFVLPVRRSAFG